MLEVLTFSAIFITFVLLIITGAVRQKSKKKYSSNTNVSVILAKDKVKNDYLSVTIPLLLSFPNITQIIILYPNKDVFTKHTESVIEDFEDYENFHTFGNFHRFAPIERIKNECVLYLKDNVMLSYRLLLKLLENYDKDVENIYGPFATYCGKHGYKQNTIYKNTLQTPIILTSRKVVQYIWNDYLHNKSLKTKFNKIDETNEDILFSYLFQKHYHKLPMTISGRFQLLGNLPSNKNSKQLGKKKESICRDIY